MRAQWMRLALYVAASAALVGCDDEGESGSGVTDAGLVGDAGEGPGDVGMDPPDEGVDPPDGGLDPDAGPEDTTPPVIEGLTLIENPNNALSAIIKLATDEPATLVVEIAGAERTWTAPTPAEPATGHDVAVLGMRFDSSYTITLRATDAAGNVAEEEHTFETIARPDDFPPIEVEGATDGYTLFDVSRWNPGFDPAWGVLLIVDGEGEVVWYHRDPDGRAEDSRRLDDGRILYTVGDEKMVIVDMLGEVQEELTAEELGLDTIHHEVYPLPNGNFALLSTALHTDVAGYTDPEGAPVTYDVVSDVVVEIDLENGAVVHAWDLFDIIDPLREGLGFHGGFWNARYAEQSEAPKDWTHSNAVILDPQDDTFIVSIRHQDWVIKIRRDDGSLVWRLGPEGDFSLAGEGAQWQYHQHAPELLGEDHILLFDNGNGRPDTETPYSRAVEYVLDTSDPEAMTAEQVWSFAPLGVYAPYVCDADLLENGNVLVGAGGQVADPLQPLGAPENLKYGQLFEVTHTDDPEVVWSLTVRDDAEVDPVGYFMYRAERLSSLYAE